MIGELKATNAKMTRILTAIFTIGMFHSIESANAQNIPYKRNVTLSVGQSVVLKGVRSNDCSKTDAPSWSRISGQLPKSKLGSFSNGGTGMVNSVNCGERVAGRGVRFTAKTKGSERFVIFDDAISVTVK